MTYVIYPGRLTSSYQNVCSLLHSLASLVRSPINHGNKSVFVSFLISVLLSLKATQEALGEQLSLYRALLDEQRDTTAADFLLTISTFQRIE